MKFTVVIIIGVFTIASAIRVPTSWSKKQNVQEHNKFRTTGRPSVGSEIGFQSRPHVVQTQKRNKINSGRRYQQNLRHPNLKKPQVKKEFKASATLDDWKPIYPPYIIQKDSSFQNNLKQPTVQKQQTFQKEQPIFQKQPTFQKEPIFQKQPTFQNYRHVNPVQHSPLYKNYRDDKTHEPNYEERTHEKHVHREKPLSVHEVPLDVPTRPIYPGEGQWAKKGIKHAPFVSKHRFTKPEEEDEGEKRPAGYETFEKNQQLFNRHQDKFRQNIDEFPQKHKLGSYTAESGGEDKSNKQQEEEEDEDEEDDEEGKQEFVPTKLYTQVRRSESDQHLPRLVDEPRLREVIKDSKIQTVYTEEGYEDLAYDHAGHEKTAEEDEGFSEFDQEIEKERQRKAKERRVVEKEDDSESAGSHPHSVKKPLRMKKGKLIKNEEVKTVAIKGQDSDSELEVVSEIKILEVPNNGTKSHKYVKIFPKVYRYDKSTTEATTVGSKDVPNPSTSTEIPQMLAVETKTVRNRRRYKRYTNDFSKIVVDTDFIDKINHNLPQQPLRIEKPKYPYYNDPSINPLSPLRYAEDLDNIPKKTEDDFAFYNGAEKVECPEIESNVDPIPARVKNADADPENMEETTDVEELVQTPRLKNLGDKIDCLKVRYFGKNPLDSPFFQEEEIGPVVPLFKIFQKSRELELKNRNRENEVDEKRSYSHNIPVQEKLQPNVKNKPSKTLAETDLIILADVVNQFNTSQKSETTTVSSALKLEIVQPKTETVNSEENQPSGTTISIITTPKYTIDLKPKHIYHQIELLEYLPSSNASKEEPETATEAPPDDRAGKSLETEPTTEAAPTQEPTPESQALKHRRRQRPRPRPRYPYYQVFDINKYLPRHTYPLLNRITRTNVMPPHGVSSEPHYKDEMKATEQLNVFADVINNIKNSSRDPEQIAASSNRMSVIVNAIDSYRKIPVVELDNDENQELGSFYMTSTTVAPRGTIKYSSYSTKDQLYKDMVKRDKEKYENLELLKVKRVTSTEPYSSDTRISSSTNEEVVNKEVVNEEQTDEEEDESEGTTDKVLGLMPPVPNRYKTIFPPKVIIPLQETKMNLFYVLGMKPPSPKQKVYLYSDYKIKVHPQTKRKYGYIHRGKRSAQRPGYSVVVRNRNKPIDVDDVTEAVVAEDDDYVPHRPKNYHYDEKTGRIVYDNVQKEKEAPEEIYIEVTEAPLPKPTRRLSATTAKPEFSGPSYVDFIKVLKNNANYTEIPDPPSTEKGEEDTTTMTTTKPVSTDPPQFLSFLSKLKTDSNYKEIPDKTTKKTTTTTTEAPEEEVEETQLENVQNSPGGQSSGPVFQIFDINEYLPKIKNYTPRTSIDYSKYKTIERASVPLRHNLSSRYNSDEEELENVKTSRVPVLMEGKKSEPEQTEITPEVSESKHEDVDFSTTTTTEAPSTITTRRTRTRGTNRGTRRTTTAAPVTTKLTQRASSSTSEEVVHIPQDKPKRIYPRRRPSRIKLNRATTEVPEFETGESISSKVIRRRHQKSEDVTNKTMEDRADTNSDEKTFKIMTPDNEEIAKLNKTQQTTDETDKPDETEKPDETDKPAENDKLADVQVFKKYDPNKKHGGNYRKEHEESESKKIHDVKRLTDVVHKPANFYTDPKLPTKVNQLVEGKVKEGEFEEENVGNGEEEEEEVGYDYEESELKTTTTKKPSFVKDPDKRLYYYAPI